MKYSKAQVDEAIKAVKEGKSVSEVATETGIPKPTLYYRMRHPVKKGRRVRSSLPDTEQSLKTMVSDLLLENYKLRKKLKK